MAYIATIGFFDGVHLGHLSLIGQLQAEAKARHLHTLIVTFTQHPLTLIQGHSPQLLLTHDERLDHLRQLDIEHILELPFETVRHMTAQTFMQLLHDTYQVAVLMMGYDHHFGSDRLMQLEEYQSAGQKVGVQVLQAKRAQQGTISSTMIRHALREGHLLEANQALGYPYTLTGTVVHGHHIGTRIGFPTANLLLPDTYRLLPKQGVYAALVNGRKALVNIGTNPTFGDHQPVSIEVHIPDFSADLYGQTLAVQLMAYVREDQHFDSEQALILQIHQDLDHLAQLLL